MSEKETNERNRKIVEGIRTRKQMCETHIREWREHRDEFMKEHITDKKMILKVTHFDWVIHELEELNSIFDLLLTI